MRRGGLRAAPPATLAQRMAIASTTDPGEGLVGREQEIGALEHALQRARRGRAVVLLRGTAGMGKSTLLAVLDAHARAAGFTAVAGRAAEYERRLPFALAVDALDDELASARLSSLGEERLAELAAVMPSVGDGGAAVVEGGPLERPRYHRAIRAAIEVIDPGRPLLLSFDDVHWADEASVELLLHLLRRPPRVPHLLAIGLRPGGVGDRIAAALRDVPEAQLLDLGPLDPAQAGRLLEQVEDADLRALVLAEAGGNPFYLRELAAEPGTAGTAGDLVAGEVPAAVVAAVAVEVERLPPGARDLARGAAVAGEPFELEVAAAAAGLDMPAAGPALDALRAADLVAATGSARELSFRHPVVRRTIYDTTPPGMRLQAHARAAEKLAARGAPAALLAGHVEATASPGDAEAAALLERAGDEALSRDPSAARRWYRSALALTDDDAVRARLLERRARACTGGGRFEEAHEALEQALALAPEQDPEAPLRLSLALAGVEHLLGKPNAAAERLQHVLEGVPPEAAALRAALEIELAINAQHRIGPAERLALTSRAMDTARELGDDVLLVSVSGLHAISLYYAGRPGDAWALTREAGRIVARTPDAALASRIEAVYHAALAATVLDDFTTADALVERAIRVGRATGQDQLLVPLLIFRSMGLHQWGRITEALTAAEEAEDSARLAGVVHPLHWALWMRATATAACGDVQAALKIGEESLRLAEGLERATVTVLGQCNYAMVRLLAGDPEGCRREMLAGAGEDFDVGEPAWSVHLLAALVLACVQLGELEEADRWAAKAEEVSSSLGDPAIPGGRARCARAEVLLARGEAQEAERLALEAAEMAAALGAELNVWQALLVAARAQAADGRRAEAVAALRRIADEANAGGAGLYENMAVHALRALGERVGRSGRRAPAGSHGLQSLSDREREIAGLVAEGRTNKEIAAALFLSDKTVERHLSRTFEKLGLRSRVELAALVHDG